MKRLDLFDEIGDSLPLLGQMFELFLGWFEPPGPDEDYRRAEA